MNDTAFVDIILYNRILPVLLKCMVYTPDDIAILEAAAENDAHIADKQEDIQPRFHKGKVHGSTGEKEAKQANGNDPSIMREGAGEEDDEEDDEDFDLDELADEWNLRKCSAAALDMLSTVFQDDLLPELLPSVNAMLNAAEWPVKEAAILAIGAIASGASSGMEPHLGQLVPHLISHLGHEKVEIIFNVVFH
jgi:transportin-1